MDFLLSDEQRMIQSAVRAFFKKEFPSSRLRQIEAKGLSEFMPVYRQLADQGFLGIAIPEEYGGAGGTWVDLALLIPTILPIQAAYCSVGMAVARFT